MAKRKQYSEMNESERAKFRKKVQSLSRQTIKTKSTKRQWFYLIMEFVTVFVGAETVSWIPGNGVASAVVAGCTFFLMVFFCVMVVRSGRKQYAVQKTDAEERLGYGKQVIDYLNGIEKEDPRTLDEQGRCECLLAYLYFASRTDDCRVFLYNTFDFSPEEIRRMFERYPMSQKLRDFVNDVLLCSRISNSVTRFEPELYALVAGVLSLQNPHNCYYENEETTYSPNGRKRFRVALDDSTGKYYVKIETWFTDYLMSSFWADASELLHAADRKQKRQEKKEHLVSAKRFSTRELAEAQKERIYRATTADFDADAFFMTEEYNPGETAFLVLCYRYEAEGARYDDTLNEILRYMTSVGQNRGHREYACRIDRDVTIAALREVLPENLLNALKSAAENPIDSLLWKGAVEDADSLFNAGIDEVKKNVYRYCLEAKQAMGYACG